MKGTFVLVLMVAFCILAIPLLSLQKTAGAVEASTTNNNIIYEKPISNNSFEKFKVLKDDKVLELSAKDYVFGVVAAEMPALYEVEALKAQAVAAYTFACYRKTENKNTKYDITADAETAQCFITRQEAASRWGEKAEEYSKKIDDCIAAVQNEILTYENAPIFAAYHAISAGNTNSCCDVWGKDVPYLKSVASEGDKLADGYLSELKFTADEIAEKLSSITTASGEIQNYFTNINATDTGYVKEINFCGKKVTGSQISKLLGLRSGNFTVTYNEGVFNFTTKGYGHGVGMSQTGADYMAKQGCTYKEILQHYYSGAILQKN